MAPAEGIPPAVRQKLFDDAVRLTSEAKYLCAGTVEYLLDNAGNYYFIEESPSLFGAGMVSLIDQSGRRSISTAIDIIISP